MKLTLAALLVCLLAATAAAAQPSLSNRQLPLVKGSGSGASLPQQIMTGGDNIGNAVVIPSLPFTDTGSTCGFANDYDSTCPGGSAPDVVYRLTPATNMIVDVTLCGSSYDTKLFVFEGGPSASIGCNDDYCGLQSAIDDLHLTGGTDYYIVVDGYGTDCGDYTLAVTEAVNCYPLVACGPFDQPENEPVCLNGYVDIFNGGCNSTPPVFQPATCATICGTAGTFVGPDGEGWRDTDWYELTVGPGDFTVTGVSADFNLQIAVLLPPNCIDQTVVDLLQTPSCTPGTISFTGPGTFWLWAGTSSFTDVPCGSSYKLTLTGPGIPSCEATASERSSWGQVKILYR